MCLFFLALIVPWQRVPSRGNGVACLGVAAALARTLPMLPHRSISIAMDKASRELAEGVPLGVLLSFRALADYRDVSYYTAYHRARGQDQQYLTPWKEEALTKFVLQIANFSYPIRIKFIPSLAYRLTPQQPPSARPRKSPHLN